MYVRARRNEYCYYFMCILSLFQGHSDSCECDKCLVPEAELPQAEEVPETEVEKEATLDDILEEAQRNQSEFYQCVKSLESTSDLLSSVVSEVKDLRTLSRTSNLPDSTSFQPLTPELVASLLCGSQPSFCYSLQPLVPVANSLWKSSRFTLQFLLTDAEGTKADKNLTFQVAAYRTIAPLSVIREGIRAKTFLRGQCLQTVVGGKVTFEKLSFAEVSSNFPGKAVILVVVCKSEDSVRPYVSPPVKVISRY